jgi:hypothetical protein
MIKLSLAVTKAFVTLSALWAPPAIAATDGLVSGRLINAQTDAVRSLTADELARISNWLSDHESDWGINVVTRAPPNLIVSLDTTSKHEAIRLLIWTGPNTNSVLREQPRGHAEGVQVMLGSDLRALLRPKGD